MTKQEAMDEFNDLIVSDSDFNYKINEFKEWINDNEITISND